MLLGVVLAAAGCKAVDPAPEDLDGLFRYYWENWEQGLDEDLAQATINIHAAAEIADLDELVDGSLEDIDRAFMDVVDMRDSADPEEHDRLRGRPGSFQTAVDGINRLKQGDDGLHLLLFEPK